jgi:hypothetical protein
VLFERHIHPLLYDAFFERAHHLGIETKRVYHIAHAEEACEIARTVCGAAFLSRQGAEHAAKDEMMLCLLEEEGISLKAQVLIRRDHPSKMVSEFVRAFIKRLAQAGLYQPELPRFSDDDRSVESAKLALVRTSVAAV